MKPIWQGTLELADVAIPVGIVPTVRDRRENMKRLHQACNTPVSLRSFCARDEELLDDEDLVTAWEVAKGEFIVLDPGELAALKPEETRRVPIGSFFALDELDPVFVRNRYLLAPSKTPIGLTAYALFAEAMHELDVAALTRFAWKGEKIAAVYSHDGATLELLVLHFAEDLVPADELHDDLADAAVPRAELALVRTLITRHTRRLEPDRDLASEWRPRIRALLDAKLAGQPIVRAEQPAADPEQPVAVCDLAAALKSSLKAAPRARRARTTAGAR